MTYATPTTEFIVEKIFEGEHKRIAKKIDDLIIENNKLSSGSSDGFWFNGDKFVHSDYNPNNNLSQMKPNTIALHPTLQDKMKEFIEDRSVVSQDRRMIKQILYRLMENCESLQDLRNSLPDFMSDEINEIRNLKRTKPIELMGFDKRTLDQYQKLLPKIEFYVALQIFQG